MDNDQIEEVNKPIATSSPSSVPVTSQAFSQDSSFSQSSAPPKKKRKFAKILITSLAAIVLAAGFALGYGIYNAPRAYAQEYLENISDDLTAVNNKLAYFLGGFDELSDSVNKSQESFYEISSTKPYEEAKADTQEDIDAIVATKDLISKTRETKSQYANLPEDLAVFNEALDGYLDQNDEALDILLTHQLFKQQMLEASGDDLNEKLNEFAEKINANTFKSEDFVLFEEISVAASVSLERFKALTDVPVTEQDSYGAKIAYLKFITQKYAEMYEAVSTQSPNSELVVELIEEVNDYVADHNEVVAISAEKYVTESDVATLFEGANGDLKIMDEELTKLRDIFKVEASIVVEG